jgi:DNA-binding transcriptional ArsR family regulator
LSDHLSATFAALSDPTRRAILARLALGETSVKELSEPFSLSAPSITKHLKVLERAGLIARGREAQWRPCRLEAAPLQEVAVWVERYRQHWEHTMNRLDDYLSTLEDGKTSTQPNPQSPNPQSVNTQSKEKKKHAHKK